MYVMSISDINKKKKELENYSSRYFWKTGIHTRLSPKYEFKWRFRPPLYYKGKGSFWKKYSSSNVRYLFNFGMYVRTLDPTFQEALSIRPQ